MNQKNKMLSRFLPILFFAFAVCNALTGQSKAILENDTLVLSNSQVEYKCLWNNGELIPLAFIHNETGKNLLRPSTQPGFKLSDDIQPEHSSFKTYKLEENNLHESYLVAEVLNEYGDFKIKRSFRIYDDAEAIACDNYIWIDPDKDQLVLQNMLKEHVQIDMLEVPVEYPRLKAVEFFDRTDQNNNLVMTGEVFTFVKPLEHRGNILIVQSPGKEDYGMFILKEAPCSFVQLNYPGYDFTAINNRISVHGIGLPPDDLIKGEWLKLYGTATGTFDGTEKGFMHSLRSYQKCLRKNIPERDEMIMMNTWGDRSRDNRISEEFLKAELDACEKLGVSHFQVDDGWQQGLSVNSGEGGNKWDIWEKEDWEPHNSRLPNGFDPVVKYARKKGIQLGLWFHPSNHNSYENWEMDAEIILDYYKNTGIRYFKIDGIKLPDKKADHRLGLLFEKVTAESDGEIVINLDATANNRTGYHYRNSYGNIFLENRYTDWGNYYPHWTLRNLWQLSAYVPTRNLQIEFLNKWRNKDVYGDHPLAPYKVPFEYTFAITMMAQPLAWFEGTGLPEEAMTVAPVIKKYRAVQAEIHSGDIFPIGSEPTGYSWTGFQSIIDENSGYIIFYREKHEASDQLVQTWLPANASVELNPVCGYGEAGKITTNSKGEIRISLPREFSYGLYKYKINK